MEAFAQSVSAARCDLPGLLGRSCDRMDEHDLQIRALLPEEHRRQRILEAARGLPPLAAEGRPLQGLLLGVKDTIAAAGFLTRCGSAVPPSAHGLPEEASVVSALRRAGMIVAGKTVTTEFAHLDPGATANPWNLAHTPGGSSSGSAAAVAGGMVHVAIGTQTVGSVNRPASFCGVCGFKPTYARLPTDGVFVASPSVDTVGFFTADVPGMSVVCAETLRDWSSAAFTGARDLPVLGVPRGAYLETFSPEAVSDFGRVVTALQSRGVRIVQVPQVLGDIDEIDSRHISLTHYEWAQSLETRWRAYGSLFRATTAMEMLSGLKVPPSAAEDGRAGRSHVRRQLEDVMDVEQIDLWITPGAQQGIAPVGLKSTGSRGAHVPWTYAGLPVLTLPIGFSESTPVLPTALQVIGRHGNDEAVLRWCERLEELLSS